MLSGVLSPDDVIVDATAKYDDKNIGTGKIITVKYSLSGNDIDNYLTPVDSITTTGEITPKQLIVSGTTFITSKVYDGTDTVISLTAGSLSGIILPDIVTVDAAAKYDNKNVGIEKTITVKYTLSGANTGNYLVPADSITATGEITAKELTGITLTADDKVYDGTTAATATPAALTIANGVINDDDVNINIISAAFSDENVGNNKTVTIVWELIGTDLSNYSLPAIQPTTTANIIAKDIAIKAKGGSSIYGDNPANPGFIVSGLVNNEMESVLTGLSNNFPINSATPVGIYTLQIVGTLTNNNYTVTTFDTGTWIVNERLLTIRAVDETIDYGQTPVLAYKIVSGNLVNGDVLSGKLYVDNYNVGIHTIEQGTLTASANYQITFEEGTLIVRSVDVSIDDVLVDGKPSQRDGNQFFGTSACGADQVSVTVICDQYATVTINGIGQNPCTVNLPKYNSNIIFITVTAQNGNTQTYTLTINRDIPFDQVVVMRWNNTLTVINNPVYNGGFIFTSFKWYCNNKVISEEQSWSRSPNGEWLNPEDEYYVELTAEGYSEVLRTCKSRITLRDIEMILYPNPVAIGQTIYIEANMENERLENATIEVYNMVGSLVEILPLTSLRIPISNKYTAGIYIFVIKGKEGFRKEVKVMVH